MQDQKKEHTQAYKRIFDLTLTLSGKIKQFEKQKEGLTAKSEAKISKLKERIKELEAESKSKTSKLEAMAEQCKKGGGGSDRETFSKSEMDALHFKVEEYRIKYKNAAACLLRLRKKMTPQATPQTSVSDFNIKLDRMDSAPLYRSK
mmetsp:Transcript_23616/g.41834  ORF Transcript_23616/g.41834 Transcript_23616/m.41834 type:complete len:147 (+) Transcript_23616:650-1090(+)